MHVEIISSSEPMAVSAFSNPSSLERLSYIAAKTCVGKHEDAINKEPETVKNFLHSTINKRGHESIMEHWSITFLISDVSRALTHQLVRHRLASYSQCSQRYTKVLQSDNPLDDVIIPDRISSNQEAMEAFSTAMTVIQEAYNKMIACGIKKEDARAISPQAHKTTIMVTMNARSLKNFFKERLWNSHAQGEIRELAKKMYELVKHEGNFFEKAYCK